VKSHRTRSLKELISTTGFKTWHAKHNELNAEVLALEEKREELELGLAIARFETEFIQGNADQTFLSAGDFEDESARSEAEFAEVENDSFQLLSDFEDKSRDEEDARIALHGVEKQLEDKRGVTSELKAQATADEKQGKDAGNISDEELKTLGGDIAGLARQVEQARSRLAEEIKRRESLWDEVEQT
jgi:chromosome segregation ATPase